MPKFRRSPTLVAALAVLALCLSSFACNQSSPTLPDSASWEQMRTAPVAVEPGDDPSPEIDTLATNDDSDCYVYITRTGSKYHRAGCRYLSQSKKRVTLEYAKSHRYGACKVCRPPKHC